MSEGKKPGFFTIIKECSHEFVEDNAMKLSASLSYYTIFAIGPLLLVIITLIGIFVDKTLVTHTIGGQIQSLLGAQGAEQIISIIESLQDQDHAHKFGIIGVVSLFISATAVFLEIQDSINFIWSIKTKPEKGWLKLITNRLLSFSLIVGLGFLLAVSLLANTIADLLIDKLARILGQGQALLIRGFGLLTLFFIITVLFTIIFKVLPDAIIKLKDAVTGAAFTGILFLFGKFLIGFYLGNSFVTSTFGAAASIIIVLLWVYYSGIILYFGAEFTKVWALHRGHGIQPSPISVYILKRHVREMPEEKEVHLSSEIEELDTCVIPDSVKKDETASDQ